MKKLIVYTIIMVLFTGCFDLSNSSSKKNLPSLTFDKTIDLFDPTEIIFDPYDLIIIHDPIYMLVERQDGCYGIINHSDGLVSRDDSFILSIWEGSKTHFTVWDFKEYTISYRKYDVSSFQYSGENFFTKIS